MQWRRLAITLVGLSSASAAHAEPMANHGTRLSFVRAENAAACSSTPVLEREIVRRMGRDPFAGLPRQWIEGFVAQQGGYFEVQLFECDASGNTLGIRRLRETAADCHQLDAAIVLAIALIIDPTAQLAPASPHGLVNAPPTRPALPENGERSTSASPIGVVGPVANSRETSLPLAHPVSQVKVVYRDALTPNKPVGQSGAAFVTADAVLLYGALPGVAPGVELTTRLALDSAKRFALRLSALHLPEKRSTSEVGRFGYGLTAMEMGFCVTRPDQRVVWQGCTAFGLGAVHAVVHTPAPLEPGDRLWTAFRFEAGVALRIVGPIWLNTRLFALIPPRNWDFQVKDEKTGTQSAFLQRRVMPGAALGLGLAF